MPDPSPTPTALGAATTTTNPDVDPACVARLAAYAETAAERASLLANLPVDWADPAARAHRRRLLEAAARQAASATVEILVADQLCAARGEALQLHTPEHAPAIDAALAALRSLFGHYVAYTCSTLATDGIQVMLDAAAATEGAGVAAVMAELFDKLRVDFAQRWQRRDLFVQ